MVATDFGEEADVAVAHGIVAARHTGSSLVVVHAVEPLDRSDLPPPLQEHHVDAVLKMAGARVLTAHEQLEAMRARLARLGVRAGQLVVPARPSEGIPAAARELRADLVVVGTHGRSGVRRWLLGSLPERLVRSAEPAVLVARRAAPPGGYRRVVIPTDFSPESARAISYALELSASDAELELVHVWEPPSVLAHPDAASVTTDVTRRIDETGAAWCQRYRDGERTLSFRQIRHHSAAATIVDAASAGDCALVAMGTHGFRGARRLLLGSVAETVVRHARCPVLVAHAIA